MAKIDVFQRIEAAEKLRKDAQLEADVAIEKANVRAKEILQGAVADLKAERRGFENKIAEIDKQLEKITGKSSSASGKGGKRVNAEAAILDIVKKSKDGISAANIMKNEALVNLYKIHGKPVAPQFIKLNKMVEAKTIGKKGSGKAAVYLPA